MTCTSLTNVFGYTVELKVNVLEHDGVGSESSWIANNFSPIKITTVDFLYLWGGVKYAWISDVRDTYLAMTAQCSGYVYVRGNKGVYSFWPLFARQFPVTRSLDPFLFIERRDRAASGERRATFWAFLPCLPDTIPVLSDVVERFNLQFLKALLIIYPSLKYHIYAAKDWKDIQDVKMTLVSRLECRLVFLSLLFARANRRRENCCAGNSNDETGKNWGKMGSQTRP